MKRMKSIKVWVWVCLLLGVSVTAVYAAFVTVDTNNTLLDTAAWAATNPSPYVGEPPDANPDPLDIDDAYVGTNGNTGSDYLYLRILTVGNIVPPTGGNEYNAIIDCDNDTVFNEAGSLVVTYLADTDEVVLSSLNPPALPTVISTTGAGTADGEIPASPNANNVEWRILKSALNANGCTNVLTPGTGIRFQFSTSVGGALADFTAGGGAVAWEAPTAVNMQSFEAVSGRTTLLLWAAMLVLMVGTLFFAQGYRRAKS